MPAMLRRGVDSPRSRSPGSADGGDGSATPLLQRRVGADGATVRGRADRRHPRRRRGPLRGHRPVRVVSGRRPAGVRGLGVDGLACGHLACSTVTRNSWRWCVTKSPTPRPGAVPSTVTVPESANALSSKFRSAHPACSDVGASASRRDMRAIILCCNRRRPGSARPGGRAPALPPAALT
jgi:hypothetical protein